MNPRERTEADEEKGAVADTTAAYEALERGEAPGTEGKEPAADKASDGAEKAATAAALKTPDGEKADKGSVGERARAQDGKFVKVEGQAPAAPAATEAASGAAEGQPAGGAASPPAAAPEISIPEHWSQLDKDRFNEFAKEIGPKGAALFLDARAGLEKAYQQRFEGIAAERRDFDTIFAPLQPELDRFRVTRAQAVDRLVGAHIALSGPQKAQAWLRIAKDYGIDPASVVGAPSASPQGQPAGEPGNGEAADFWLDPAAQRHYGALDQRLAGLAGTVDQLVQAQVHGTERAKQEAGQRAQSALAAFQNAKGTDGKPLHPYYADLRDDMAVEYEAAIQRNQPITLEQAYERASWKHSEVRTRLLAQREKEAAERIAKEREEDVKRAKAGGVPAQPVMARAPRAPSEARETPMPRDNPMADVRAVYADLEGQRV